MRRIEFGVLAVLAAALSLSAAVPCRAALTDGLVAYYSFDDGTARNQSANGAALDGTVGSGVTPAAGILGQAFSFPGVHDVANDAIRVPDQALLDVPDSITVSAWVKTTSSLRQAIVSKQASGNNSYQLEQYNAYAANFNINTSPGSAGTVDCNGFGSNPINTGNWVYVVGTYDGTTMKLYVNGVLDRQRANSGPLYNDNIPLVIGDWISSGRPFNGEIDEVGIWSRALSPAEIQELYNNGNGFDPVSNQPPNVSNAAPSVASIWPPNNKMVNIAIQGVTDPNNDPVTITITGITDNEGSNPANAGGIGTSTAQVRAQRNGNGNGRTYTIAFTASDGRGGVTPGTVKVSVPHDQGNGKAIGRAGKTAVDFSVDNYPNPFNPSTTIRYALPEGSRVRLVIYNLLGQEVRSLVNASQGAGVHTVQWDGRDAYGHEMTSGIYLYRLEAGQHLAIRKLMLLK